MFDKAKGLLAALAAKRGKEAIGKGAYGVVYSGKPGAVVKQIANETPQKILNEINLQAKAADLNIAPVLKEAQINQADPTIGGSITMQDLRKNYIPLGVPTNDVPFSGSRRHPGVTEISAGGHFNYYDPSLSSTQVTQAQVDTHKQLAQLALNNVMLEDRHVGNIFVNKISNRPMQIDFGMARELKTPSEKAGALAYHVGNGLNAAGLNEEAKIFSQLVNEVGQFDFETNSYNNPEAALDMAKQGLSRLQKIKAPQVEQIAVVRQQQLSNARKLSLPLEQPVVQQRLNTWGEPIEKGYYGTPI
jgi:hypothetical protein